MMCLHFGCRHEASTRWSEPFCELHVRPALKAQPRPMDVALVYEDDEDADDELDPRELALGDVAGGFMACVFFALIALVLV